MNITTEEQIVITVSREELQLLRDTYGQMSNKIADMLEIDYADTTDIFAALEDFLREI